MVKSSRCVIWPPWDYRPMFNPVQGLSQSWCRNLIITELRPMKNCPHHDDYDIMQIGNWNNFNPVFTQVYKLHKYISILSIQCFGGQRVRTKEPQGRKWEEAVRELCIQANLYSPTGPGFVFDCICICFSAFSCICAYLVRIVYPS